VFPEVMPVLEEVRSRGLVTAVVSNWDHRLPGLLDRLGPPFRFQAVVYSQRARVEKPEPGIFRQALRELRVQPDEAVHVGDRRREDLEGAQAAGLHALLVDRRGGAG